MRIALAQINVTVGDFAGIRRRIRQAWERGADEGVELVVFPELTTTGYPPNDLLRLDDFVDDNLALRDELARWTADGPAMLIGYVERHDGPGAELRNAAGLLAGGQQIGTVHKSLLPTYDVFDEERYFEPAERREPLELDGVQLGVTICEDIWSSPSLWEKVRYKVDPCQELVDKGAQLLINISASPFELGKSSTRRDVVAGTARKHGRPIVYVNQVGAHDELIFDGHSLVADADGTLQVRARDFREDFAVVDVPTPGDGSWTAPSLHRVASSEEEELYRALVRGTRDYVLKSGFHAVVIGLSGGIDSSVVAAIAADAVGPENVLGIAMPTRYSSDHSVEDAEQLATNLGVEYREMSIDASFQAMLDQLAPAFRGMEADVTEENIQARLRGLTLMAFSNKLGRLLLTTGNKSELSVGYCTLYGDMCGALAVIGDVAKTRLYRLARWMNRDGVRIPERVLTKPPSAELAPDQTDQDSLPPYEQLDDIVEGYVERRLDAEGISDEYDLPLDTVRDMIALIHRNEFKRLQAAPVLKVTSKAFGIGRRVPIVSRYDP